MNDEGDSNEWGEPGPNCDISASRGAFIGADLNVSDGRAAVASCIRSSFSNGKGGPIQEPGLAPRGCRPFLRLALLFLSRWSLIAIRAGRQMWSTEATIAFEEGDEVA